MRWLCRLGIHQWETEGPPCLNAHFRFEWLQICLRCAGHRVTSRP